MEDHEIEGFIKDLKSFMDRADVEMLNYLRRETTREYHKSYHQLKADMYNVSFDYYQQEFNL
tara:strand:- start:2269 stop:2454 length:186 start_codon:yes stop_codon:yes gene_type:complete